MVEPNLESLIKDLYNHARHDLSEDLVAALLDTAKKLPTTNEQLLAVRLSGLVNHELLLNPKHPKHLSCSIWLVLSREKKPSTEEPQFLRLCMGRFLKCFDSIVDQSIFWYDGHVVHLRCKSSVGTCYLNPIAIPKPDYREVAD